MAAKKKRPRGRPKLPRGQERDSTLQIRLKAAERRAVQKSADAAGRPVSAWARSVLLREAGLG